MCALFSKTVLHLTWWPLFRDCSFYSVALIILILCFRDSQIKWYEALVLLCIYASYVTFMKYNQNCERLIKRLLFKNRVTRVSSTDHLMVSLVSDGGFLEGRGEDERQVPDDVRTYSCLLCMRERGRGREE
ncbi:unnamed protein product [Allacma fusca]|uniref:Uncharacterized protein n=1 Tax=Allacma fusca TaxID=39272 RepID=A0A8J2K7R4_9HEXA|nr:unnamed protein product [Allacma fusca]